MSSTCPQSDKWPLPWLKETRHRDSVHAKPRPRPLDPLANVASTLINQLSSIENHASNDALTPTCTTQVEVRVKANNVNFPRVDSNREPGLTHVRSHIPRRRGE